MKRLAIISVVLLVAAIALFVVTRDDGSSSTADDANIVTDRSIRNALLTNSVSNENVNTTTQREQMLAVARLFAERYGTVSSSNTDATIDSVMPFASDALKVTLERMKKNSAATATVTTTSQALSFSVGSFEQNQGRAEVAVTLQRKEQSGTSAVRTYIQTLQLTMTREHDAWKVSVAAWEPTQ